MMPNTPSLRPVHLIAGASRHPSRNKARSRIRHLPIAFHRAAVFQARHAGRCLSISATHLRLVPRLVLSRLVERLVPIPVC